LFGLGWYADGHPWQAVAGAAVVVLAGGLLVAAVLPARWRDRLAPYAVVPTGLLFLVIGGAGVADVIARDRSLWWLAGCALPFLCGIGGVVEGVARAKRRLGGESGRVRRRGLHVD
jgi:hypothetical protein